MKCDTCKSGWTVFVNGKPIKCCPHTNCKNAKQKGGNRYRKGVEK